MRRFPSTWAALAAALLFVAVADLRPADAQFQVNEKRKCIVSMNKAASKLMKTVVKQGLRCAKAAEDGGVVNVPVCIAGDSGGRIAKAQEKVVSAEQKKCSTLPDFGYSSAATINQAVVQHGTELAEDVFSDSTGNLSADGSGCRRAIVQRYGRLFADMLKGFSKCKDAGLKNATIGSSVQLENCYLTVGQDAKGKLQKATTALMIDFVTNCPLHKLDELTPGICKDAQGILSFGICIDALVRCRTCLTLNDVDALDHGCDIYDNGLSDRSCPPLAPGDTTTTTTTTSTTTTTVPICGNGVLQAGEECDDGNSKNRDNCTNSCTIAVCGDHIQCSEPECTTGPGGGPEVCDGAASGLCPGACQPDCSCPGTTLPPTTTTTTTSTTTTTTTTTIPDEQFFFPNACIDVVINIPIAGGPQQIKNFGEVTMVVEYSSVTDSDGDNLDEVEVEILSLNFEGCSPGQGCIEVRQRDPAGHPSVDQRSRGTIEEHVNTTPGVMDWTPNGAGGTAHVQVDTFVEAEITGQINTVVHIDIPIDMQGQATEAPPVAGDVFVMLNPEPIPVLNSSDGSFLNSTLDSATLELNATSCETE